MLKWWLNKILILLISILIMHCGSTNMGSDSHNKSKSRFNYPVPFEVVYSIGGNQLNSVENYIQKDLVLDGYIQARYELTENEKIKIYKAAKDIDWSTYPKQIKGTYLGTKKELWIKYGIFEKRLEWNIDKSTDNENEQKLLKLENVLNEILFDNYIYQSFPKARGGYR